MKKSKNKTHKKDKAPNPYLIALYTAMLSGVFAILGFYFTAKFQTERAIQQKIFEYRISAYDKFLSSMSGQKSPLIAETLNIGQLAQHVATDSEIQTLEDKFYELSLKNSDYKISWHRLQKKAGRMIYAVVTALTYFLLKTRGCTTLTPG